MTATSMFPPIIQLEDTLVYDFLLCLNYDNFKNTFPYWNMLFGTPGTHVLRFIFESKMNYIFSLLSETHVWCQQSQKLKAEELKKEEMSNYLSLEKWKKMEMKSVVWI